MQPTESIKALIIKWIEWHKERITRLEELLKEYK